jgi:hypothetical protein
MGVIVLVGAEIVDFGLISVLTEDGPSLGLKSLDVLSQSYVPRTINY